MDERFTISQLAERDAPALMMTEKLVICLRACTLFATTRRASQVRLTSSGTGFASELMLISNKGLDALVDAYTFLNTLSLRADSMAKPGGTLERLQSTFGVPTERKSHDRHMRRLEEEIEACRSGGADLEKKLTTWRTEVENFQRIVSMTNDAFANESVKKDDEIARCVSEIADATVLLHQGEDDEAEAKSRYQESQKYQRSLIYGVRLPQTLNAATVLEMTYTAIRLGWSWYTSGVAAQDVKKTEEELERRRKSAENCKREIAEAEFELQKLSGQSKQLSDFTKALTPTLQALVCLTDNLRALVLGFSAMEPLLKMLISRQAETNSISEDARYEPASLADVRDFAENAKAMGAWALKIEHLAWLYASIIENVLTKGLRTVQRAANSDGDSFSESLDFFHAAQQQQFYLQDGGSSCNTIRSQVDAKYEQKMLAMEAKYETERKKFAKQDEKARKKASSGKRNFFSRK